MAKESEPNGLIPEETDSKRRLDPELRAIGQVIRVLDDAKEEGANTRRILNYLYNRFADGPHEICVDHPAGTARPHHFD